MFAQIKTTFTRLDIGDLLAGKQRCAFLCPKHGLFGWVPRSARSTDPGCSEGQALCTASDIASSGFHACTEVFPLFNTAMRFPAESTDTDPTEESRA